MKKVVITTDNVEEIIAKKCDGLANQNEVQALEIWRSASSENDEHYRKIMQTNTYYAGMKANEIDVEKAWNQVRTRMKKDEGAKQKSGKSTSTVTSLWKLVGYAASAILLITAGTFVLDLNEKSEFYTTDVALVHELKDGSTVQLGKNSALSKISTSEREYNFSGEAEFEVIHDEERPFVVHMNNILVKDLGTVFHIKSVPSSDTVFVKVTEGIAQFYTLTNEGIILEHGEEGMYIKSKNEFYKRSIDENNQVLSINFQNASFDEVLDHLAYSFRKNITIQNEMIRNCDITVDFTKATFTEVKDIIEVTLDIQIHGDLTSLSIEGKGCQ